MSGKGTAPVSAGGWPTVAPSPLAFEGYDDTTEMTREQIDVLVDAWAAAAARAVAAGFEVLEIHAAHGYLLHEFLSPLSNQRNDAYGGSFDNRTRLIREVFTGVRQVFDGTLGIRLSGTDWVEGGWTVQESVQLSRVLRTAGAQYVHMSSGGISPQQKIALGPGYQVPLARAVRDATELPTIAVGLITEPAQAEAVLANGDADLVALARAFLYNPRWGWSAAAALQGQVQAQPQYWRCLPAQATGVFGPGARIGMR